LIRNTEMKIIAYSQVPNKHTYVHLAYLSATTSLEGPLVVVLGGITLLAFFLIGLRNKLSRAWRRTIWMGICLLIIILLLLFLASIATLSARTQLSG